MAPRTYIQAPREAWERLGALVRRRGTELGLSQQEAVDRSGGRISLTVWSILEGARQTADRMEDRSLDGASSALQWPQHALQQLLAGAEPDDLEPPPPPGGAAQMPGPVPADQDSIGLAALVGQLPPEKRAAIEAVVRAMLDES